MSPPRERVEVNTVNVHGATPLVSACNQLIAFMGHVGAVGDNDPTCVLVLKPKSRRITPQGLAESIALLRRCMPTSPTSRMIRNAEVGGEPLQDVHKVAHLILPVLVLTAQARGHFRYCAHCLQLTPDLDLDRCGGCNKVGYCPLPYKRAIVC